MKVHFKLNEFTAFRAIIVISTIILNLFGIALVVTSILIPVVGRLISILGLILLLLFVICLKNTNSEDQGAINEFAIFVGFVSMFLVNWFPFSILFVLQTMTILVCTVIILCGILRIRMAMKPVLFLLLGCLENIIFHFAIKLIFNLN